MLDIKQFGKRIAFLRRQNGMSQVKLAEFHIEKNITIIHGDLHPGNIFLSKSPSTSVKMIDMEAFRVGLCTEDLAMLMGSPY